MEGVEVILHDLGTYPPNDDGWLIGHLEGLSHG
jgi:hypothetical protein